MGHTGTSGIENVNPEYRIPLLVEGEWEYSATLVETRIGRFELDPDGAGKADLELYFVGFLADAGAGAPTVELRLYDVGPPNAPVTGDLRATITTTATNAIVRESVALTASGTPTVPGSDPNDGTIYNVVHVYEVRVIFTAGDAGDTIRYDTVGILS